MREYGPADFRILHWPGTPVPEATVMWLQLEPREGSLCETIRLPRRKVMPPELYLWQENDVDLSDGDALFSFAASYGMPLQPDWSDLPGGIAQLLRNPDAAGRHEEAFARLVGLARAIRSENEEDTLGRLRFPSWDADAEPAGFIPRILDSPIDSSAVSMRTFIHLDEVAMCLSLVRDLTRLWRACKGDKTLDYVRAQWESFAMLPPRHERDAALMLEEVLNTALRSYPVCIAATHGSNSRLISDYDSLGPSLLGAGPVWEAGFSCYQAMCLQLANHIAENAKYGRCAADGCERLFVRQQGRAKRGQHRTSGKLFYCSERCAKREARRKFVLRKNALNDGASS